MLKVILMTYTLLFTSFALAWYDTGHKVVGEIAEAHLSADAKVAVKKIIGQKSLAEISTWADDVKSQRSRDFQRSWHYASVPDHGLYQYDQSKEDVITQSYRMLEIINSKVHDRRFTKEQALAMLVHMIGDLHQPLHVGRKEDKGGNRFMVKWYDKDSNLHRVWDNDIINSTGLSYLEISKLINKKEHIKKSWYGKTIEDWANESVSYRAQVYDLLPSPKDGPEKQAAKLKPHN